MSSKRPEYLDELSDPLRRAAEAIHAAAPPAAAERRAVERARRALRARAAARPRFRRDLLAIAGMAATILVGIVLWNSYQGGAPQSSVTRVPDDGGVAVTSPKPRSAHEAETGLWDGKGDDNEKPVNERGQEVKDLAREHPPMDPSVRTVAIVNSPDVTNPSGRPDKLQPGYLNPKTGTEATTAPPGPRDGTGGTVATVPPVPTPSVPQIDSKPGESPRLPHPGEPGGYRPPTPGIATATDTSGTPGRPKLEPSSSGTDYLKAKGENKGPYDRPGQPGEAKNQSPADRKPDTARINLSKDQDNAIRALLLSTNDKEKGKDFDKLKEQWGQLGDKARVAELEKLTKGLPVEKRNAVYSVFENGPKTEPEKGPAVWHRDRLQPTMARVYIGDRNSLELVSLNVTTTVEGPRARTVVDHIFRNPHPRQLEGTFEYPLPTGASPSYFGMFLGQSRSTVPSRFNRHDLSLPTTDALAGLKPEQLLKHVDAADWGDLREGRVVNNQKALETYEDVVRGKVDPGLLEYAGGNMFRGRVFPIPAQGYNRVVIAYEETLPVSTGQMVYRFPLPGVELPQMQFTLRANAAECLEPVVLPKGARKETLGGGLSYTLAWEMERAEGEVVFRATPAEPRVQTISGRHGENGPSYVYTCLRPELKTVAKDEPFARHAVFLLDTSLSERADRFNVSMMLLKRILEDDPDIQIFNVLAFNAGAAWVSPKGWLPNTKAGRDKALAKLDGIVLEGATDFSAALDKLANPGFDVAAGTPVNCFVLSDGNITWGEGDVASLVAKFGGRSPMSCRFQCYRTGLGAENLELYEALTRKGGGILNCYGEADLKAAAQAHRNHCLHVENVRLVGGPTSSDLLVAGRRAAVYPGGELVLAARVNGTGRVTALVEGTFRGKKYAEEFPIEVGSTSELAPRAWAEVAVASLQSLNDSKLDGLVTAYCQQFGIVGKTASFLILENDADYKRFNLEEERGKTLVTDVGEFLDSAWAAMGKVVGAHASFVQFLDRIESRVNVRKDPGVAKLLTLAKDKDFELACPSLEGCIVRAKDVPAAYLEGMQRDPSEVGTYLTECRRRADKGDVNGAVCALSSVIEEHQGRSDANRLVGYRLLDLKQPQQAARLFERVQRQRPFEPHSYRDLARSLEESGLYAAAAINYEIVLAGTWHGRFQQDLKTVVLEEYVRMMQEAIRKKAVSKEVADVFGERLEGLAGKQKPADLRVTISWNTDATDVDLWVIEPDGTKCYYQHKATKNGGELSADMTQGYGPERYQIETAPKGTFQVLVHYYGTNPNLLGGETHVKVAVTRDAGRPTETTENHTVILKRHNEQVEVCKVKF
jgi:hypothetical protein